MHPKKCELKNYFPVGKNTKVKAGTIICVNALLDLQRYNFSIIVPPSLRIIDALNRNRTDTYILFH